MGRSDQQISKEKGGHCRRFSSYSIMTVTFLYIFMHKFVKVTSLKSP